MSTPPEGIIVTCPACNHIYEDWIRRSLSMGYFSKAYWDQATSAVCPTCKKKVRIKGGQTFWQYKSVHPWPEGFSEVPVPPSLDPSS